MFQRAAQHSHFALNLNMVIAEIAQILIPLGVQAVVPDNSRSQVRSLSNYEGLLDLFRVKRLFYNSGFIFIIRTKQAFF